MSDIFVSRGIGGGPWVAESVQSKAASFTYLAHSLSGERLFQSAPASKWESHTFITGLLESFPLDS